MPIFGVARKYAKDIKKYLEKLSYEGIGAYEMGFAYGIPDILPEEAIEYSYETNIQLSVHLPFWINLGNNENKKNQKYLQGGLKIANDIDSIAIFHLGFYGGKKYKDLEKPICKIIKDLLDLTNFKKGKLGIETTGKQKAIGTLEETISIVNIIDDNRVIPIIDWSHLYARNDGFYPYSVKDFEEILKKTEKSIGYKPNYFHGGGIEYKNGNEIKHQTAKICQPALPYLFQAFQNLNYEEFTLIIESPDSINDIKWLKEVWKNPAQHYHNIPEKKKKMQKSMFDFI